jgi:hypothetical protein
MHKGTVKKQSTGFVINEWIFHNSVGTISCISQHNTCNICILFT